METRQPDEVGALGEKTAGPLSLARPKGSFGQCLGAMLLFCGSAYYGEDFKQPLMDAFGWGKEDAHSMVNVLEWVFLFAAFWVWHWRLNSANPHLSIVKNERGAAVSTDEALIFTDGSKWQLVLLTLVVLGCSLLCAALIWQLRGARWPQRLELIFVVLLVGGFALNLRQRKLQATFVLNREGAVFRGRCIGWQRVQAVEVEHRVAIADGFAAVQLTFFDSNHRKLARVELPKDKCDLAQEEKILAFIAARLGRRFEHLAHSPPDWL